MKNKKGLVMGVANQKSIAWGIAEVLSAEGASLALTYQGENFKKRVEPLAEGLGSKLIFDVDVTDESSVDRCFNNLSKEVSRARRTLNEAAIGTDHFMAAIENLVKVETAHEKITKKKELLSITFFLKKTICF